MGKALSDTERTRGQKIFPLQDRHTNLKGVETSPRVYTPTTLDKRKKQISLWKSAFNSSWQRNSLWPVESFASLESNCSHFHGAPAPLGYKAALQDFLSSFPSQRGLSLMLQQ